MSLPDTWNITLYTNDEGGQLRNLGKSNKTSTTCKQREVNIVSLRLGSPVTP